MLETDGEVAGTRHDAQNKGEGAETRRQQLTEEERWSTSVHVQPTTLAKGNGQHTSTDNGNVPEALPDPPPLLDELMRRPIKSPSVEPDGEWSRYASCENVLTGNATDMLGVSRPNGDAGNVLMKPLNTPERQHKPVEQEGNNYAPRRAQDELDAPGDNVDASTTSEYDEDPRNVPKKLHNTSEHV